jgi:hypothetical protein
MEQFVLTKWYLDAVDAGGRAAILYSTALRWGRASVGWHGVSICESDRRVTHRTSVKPVSLPERNGDRLSWRSDPLGCAVDCRSNVPPFVRRLADSPAGVLDWCCEAPAARVDVTLADAPALTLLPWRLPIEGMRWGRWVSDDGTRSLVWNDWNGPRPRTDVYLDGRPEASPVVDEGEVSAGGVRLTLSPRRQLYSRSLDSALAGLGAMLKLLPGAWRDLEDAKWICRARLDGPAGAEAEGWCIDEVVRFPR